MVAGYTSGAQLRFPPIASSTERLNDQVQARVYLAVRIYADTEPARQDADQGIRIVPDARTASAVGLRRLLDVAGRRPQLRLRAQARRGLSGWRAHQRRSGNVRSDDAGWRHAARHQQAR